MDQHTAPSVLPFVASREPCPLEHWLDILTGAWVLRILWILLDGEPHRFAEIERAIGPVSAKVLTEKLRELEQKGIVQRAAMKSAVPHVEYRLTERGKLLEPVFRAMEQVARQMFSS